MQKEISMRFQDLSAEQQRLVQTDFGDLEKEAAARVQLSQEMYATGFHKLATETADWLDKAAEEAEKEEKKEKDEDLDEESKTASAELGDFIERGYFDGLRKLGSERHGNELHYIIPFIEARVAEEGAKLASASAMEKLKNLGAAAMGHARSVG